MLGTLWFQLEDMFQLIEKPQGIIHQVTVQLKDTPTLVYSIGAKQRWKKANTNTCFNSIDHL